MSTAATVLTLRPPADYLLARDVCSYGYFVLAPNRWDPTTQTLSRALELDGGAAMFRVRQSVRRGGRPHPHFGGTEGAPLRVEASRVLSRAERADARRQLRRMLRLDETADEIRRFHELDPRWRRVGRGRLFRSPTLFEDIVKTVTSCNVQWPGTVQMNARLCEVLGDGGAFPSARRLSRARPGTLRARCRVGYRDVRLVELARLFVRGEIGEAQLEDPLRSDDELHDLLLKLPGVGPYAAANIMQLLGRYGRLPLDTESVRHGRTVLGYGGSDAEVMRAVRRHFEPFGDQAFRSYWFELWAFYEGRKGPSHLWEAREVAGAFTAAKLNGPDARRTRPPGTRRAHRSGAAG